MINRPFKIDAANFSCFRGALLVVVAVAVTGCASSRPPEPAPSARPPVDVSMEPAAPPASESASPSNIEANLRSEIDRWQGTPHRWGGITTTGADCSGFVYSVYRDLFAISLPRTTSDQVRVGTAVDVRQLQAGDLVFFRPSKRTNHVGIYLSDGHFAHISTSRGLMLSHLDEDYWQRAYWTSRRVLPAGAASSGRDVVPWRDQPAESGGARGGW